MSNEAGIKYLDDGNSSGTVMGKETTSLIGFHGATPIAKATVARTITTTATTAALDTDLTAIKTALQNLGLIG